MRNPFIQKIAAALYQAQDAKSAREIQALAQRAIEMLAKKRLLTKSAQLFAALERERLRAEKKVIVQIASREPIAKTLQREIREKMQKKFKKDVELVETIDTQILGGMRISIGDTLIDATLNNTLKNLSQHFLA